MSPGTRRSRLCAWLLRRMGWTLLRPDLPGPKGIIVAYPHTSAMDFFVGVLAKWALGWPVRFWAKQSLFYWPLVGSWLRYLGGVPVRRHKAHGLVAQTLVAMQNADWFWLAVTPEGTRAAGRGWRTGFYHVWQQANVPLGLAVLDYRSRVLGVRDFLACSGDMTQDFARIAELLTDAQGYRAHCAAPIQPLVSSHHTQGTP